MRERPLFTRREFLQISSGFLLGAVFSREGFFSRQKTEEEPSFLEAGDVVQTAEGQTYLLKQEKDDQGEVFLCRYLLEDPNLWKRKVGYRGEIKKADQSLLGGFPLAEAPQEEVPFWDGSTKRHNKKGGIKLIFIAGLGTRTHDDNSFAKIQKTLKELGFDEADILESTYKTGRQKPLLGVPYGKEDSTQNPLRSLAVMDSLFYLWKRQFPLDKFWPFGHSQGGWLAYELARRHPDAVGGVITFDGALKGADVTPLPTLMESLGAKIFGGEAGEFFVKRGGEQNVFSSVESEVEKLKKKGIIFVSFASTDDRIVKWPHALVVASNRLFGGEETELTFPMGSWLEWQPSQEIAEFEDPWGFDLEEAPEARASAQLKLTRREYVGSHGAVLAHPKVLESLRLIISSQIETKTKIDEKIWVVSVYPSLADIPSVWPDIEIIFNRPISPNQVSFSSEPFFPVEVLTEEETEERIPPGVITYVPRGRLKMAAAYKITLKFNGEEFSWTFFTPNTPAGGARGWGRGNRRAGREFEKEMFPKGVEIIDSLIEKMPYYGNGFWMVYSPVKETFFIHLCEEPFAQAKKEAERWLAQQGWEQPRRVNTPTIKWFSRCEPPILIFPLPSSL